MEIKDVECSRLNDQHMIGNAKRFADSFGNLMPSGKERKIVDYLQNVKSPGLKAQIKVHEGGAYELVGCAYEGTCGNTCDFRGRI